MILVMLLLKRTKERIKKHMMRGEALIDIC
jgi:hypothetical protein